MINWIVEKLSNRNTSVDIEDNSKSTLIDLKNETVLTSQELNIPPIEIVGNGNSSMLIVDDDLSSHMLYGLILEEHEQISKTKMCDTHTQYLAKGPMAGFIAADFIDMGKQNIDVAILDITLETYVKLENEVIVGYDGIDIAELLVNANPNVRFIFCTAHAMGTTTDAMNKYTAKYKQIFKQDINTVTYTKDRINQTIIGDLLYGRIGYGSCN